MTDFIKFELNVPITVTLLGGPSGPQGQYNNRNWETDRGTISLSDSRVAEMNAMGLKGGDAVTFEKVNNPDYPGSTIITIRGVDSAEPEDGGEVGEKITSKDDLIISGFKKIVADHKIIMSKLNEIINQSGERAGGIIFDADEEDLPF